MLNKIPYWLKNKYAITILVCLIWLFFFDQNNLLTQWEYKKELNTLLEDKKFYLEQIEKTQTELKELTTNPATLEKFAREKYLMKKSNEQVFVFEVKEE